MSKYRRWERPEPPVPEWLASRERVPALRPFLGGLRCEECLEPVAQTQFVSGGGLCLRCWHLVQASMVVNAAVLVGDGERCGDG